MAAAILLPSAVIVQMVALGANGAALAVVAAMANLCVAIACQFLLRTEEEFWRRTAWATGVFALIVLWIAAPAIVPRWMPGRASVLIAPDLIQPAVARLMGLYAAMIAAAMIGYRHGLMRFSIDMLLLFAIFHISLSLLMRSADPEHIWGFEKGLLLTRFTGTFLNANASGCLFGVFALLACGRGLGLIRESTVLTGDPRAVARLLLYIVAFILSIGACLITHSRAALTLTVLLLIWMGVNDRHMRGFARRTAGKVSIGLLAAGSLILFVMFAGDVIDRFQLIGQDSVDRVMIWSRYARLAFAAIHTGYGPLSFQELNLQQLANPADAAIFWYINAPHNALLSILIEGGWPYLAMWCGLLAGITWQVWRWRRSERQDAVVNAIAAACILILGCSMVDITLDVPAMAGLFMILIGFIWGHALRRASDHQAIQLRFYLPRHDASVR